VTASLALVLVGAELVEGRRTDGNGAWLAREVAAAGVRLVAWEVVSDEPREIARAVRAAAARASLVIVSGGLGPTPDDRTREGLALAAGVPLEHDEGAWRAIQAELSRRGREAHPLQRSQALVPRGGAWLANPAGIAPGLALSVGDAEVLAFPGVPIEFRSLFEREARPRLVALPGRVETALVSLATAGVPETEILLRLGDLAASAEPSVGWYPHHGEVEVTITAHGPGARERAADAARTARARLGACVLDVEPGERLEHAVVRALLAARLRVATAESLTGGLVARMLTRVPGASAVIPAGFVTYSDEAKARDLGVPAALLLQRGAVSAEVAAAMAEGARLRAGTDCALSTTGVAGPGDLAAPDGAPLPAGTAFIAVSIAGRAPVGERLLVPLDRELVQRRVAVAALDLLRRNLLPLRPEGR
jgi:nicotinamide-nucleotide amidase